MIHQHDMQSLRATIMRGYDTDQHRTVQSAAKAVLAQLGPTIRPDDTEAISLSEQPVCWLIWGSQIRGTTEDIYFFADDGAVEEL